MQGSFCFVFMVVSISKICFANSDVEEGTNANNLYKIEGKVSVSMINDPEWVGASRVLVDGGEYLGFLK